MTTTSSAGSDRIDALDTLERELHSTIADIQWVVTGYMLALAAVIPVTGWRASRRRPWRRRLAA